MSALSHVRVCDFGGQLAGAGATKMLAAFGAQVIRVEDPVTQGRWDMLRGVGPFVDDRRGIDLGGGFNNHNVGKLGITLNLRTPRGRELLTELVRVSDVVTENFAAGVMARLGFGYDELRAIRSDVIYVSNSGFGHSGPYREFKTWGPIVQAISGLTFLCGLPDDEPAGWGFSYMDHGAACLMAMTILGALHERERTGNGQWVDLASTTAGLKLLSTAVLDWTVNGRPSRRPGMPAGNRADFGEAAPHGVYPARGDDRWVALACRDDNAWRGLARLVSDPALEDDAFATLAGRLARHDELDERLTAWTSRRDADAAVRELLGAGVAASVVKSPAERIDGDEELAAWGLFPEVRHPEIGTVRVEGLPLHLSDTDWEITDAAPCLGEDDDDVLRDVLGLTDLEIDDLRKEGVI